MVGRVINIWQDIKETFGDAFSFLQEKDHQRNLIIVSVIAFFYILPNILLGAPYNDDFGRFTNGVAWDHDARFIQSFISRWLSFYNKAGVFPLYPYGQILASLLYAWSGYLLAIILGVKSNFARITTSLILLTFPFTLPNLAYLSESHYMAIALFALMPSFLFIRKPLYFFFFSILGLLINLFTYQASFSNYTILVCLLVLILATEDKDKAILKLVGLSISILVVTLFIYKILMIGADKIYGSTLDLYKTRGEMFTGFSLIQNLFVTVPQAIFKGIGGFSTSYYHHIPILFGILFLSLFIYFKEIFSPLKNINKIWFSLAFFAIPFLAIGLLGVLKNPYSFRAYLPITFAIMGYLVFSARYYPKLSSLFSFFLILFSFILMSNIYLAKREDHQWEQRMILEAFGGMELPENVKVISSGSIPRTPFSRRVWSNHPSLNILNSSTLSENIHQGTRDFLRLYNFAPTSVEQVPEEQRQKILANRLDYPIIRQGTFFVVRQKEDIFILDFKKDAP